MPFTDNEGWRYPLLTDRFVRAHIETLAEDMHASLESQDTARLAALRRTSGILGASVSAGTVTSTAAAYLAWNVDHLSSWAAGGAAVTSTQGPTLPTGLYRVDLHATVTATTGTATSYLIEVERAVGVVVARRRFVPAQPTWSMSAAVHIPIGSPQQLRAKVTVNAGVASSVTLGRLLTDASPRLAWTFIAGA